MELIIIIVIIYLVFKKTKEAEAKNKRSNRVNKNTQDQWQQLAMDTLMKDQTQAQKKAQAKAQKAYAQTQVKQAQVPTIVQRAKENAAENVADVTLETMEREHKHSERVAPAVHHHPEDILDNNVLGTVEDLMVKGYDGNLCFERDFVGEAMDMINRFTA